MAYLITAYKDDTYWYNIYSNGWCEQGGNLITGDSSSWQNATITLVKTMLDTDYHANVMSAWKGNGDGASYYIPKDNKTTSSFIANVTSYVTAYGYSTWEVKGYLAPDQYVVPVIETRKEIIKY